MFGNLLKRSQFLSILIRGRFHLWRPGLPPKSKHTPVGSCLTRGTKGKIKEIKYKFGSASGPKLMSSVPNLLVLQLLPTSPVGQKFTFYLFCLSYSEFGFSEFRFMVSGLTASGLWCVASCLLSLWCPPDPCCGPDPHQAALPCCGPQVCSGKMSTNDPINKTDTASQTPQNQDTGPCAWKKCKPQGTPESPRERLKQDNSTVESGKGNCSFPHHRPNKDWTHKTWL